MEGGSAFAQFVPLILIFAIMYFLLIRPQQKKLKDHQAMVAALRRGDQVITQGGIVGKVTKVRDEQEVELEIAEGVKVRVIKSTVAQVINKTEPDWTRPAPAGKPKEAIAVVATILVYGGIAGVHYALGYPAFG